MRATRAPRLPHPRRHATTRRQLTTSSGGQIADSRIEIRRWRSWRGGSTGWWRGGSCWSSGWDGGRSRALASGAAARGPSRRLRRRRPADQPTGSLDGGCARCGSGAVLSHRSAARLWRLAAAGDEWIEVTRSARPRAQATGIVSHESRCRDDEWLVGRRDSGDFAVPDGLRPCRGAEAAGAGAGLARGGSEGAAGPGFVADAAGAVSGAAGDAEPAGAAGGDGAGGVHAERLRGGVRGAGRRVRPAAAADERRPWRCAGGSSRSTRSGKSERVAVELDSRSVHGTNKNFESDQQRDRILLAEGWRTMRVTWRQLQDEPECGFAGAELADRRLGRAVTHTHPASRCG